MEENSFGGVVFLPAGAGRPAVDRYLNLHPRLTSDL
jgi:hypothetical protein